jgi:hypothetical protein
MSLIFYPDDERARSTGPGWGEFSGKIDCDNHYPQDANGYSIPSNMQFEEKFSEVRGFFAENKDGYTFEYDSTNKTIRVYSGGTEVAHGTDLSALTGINVFIRGWL